MLQFSELPVTMLSGNYLSQSRSYIVPGYIGAKVRDSTNWYWLSKTVIKVITNVPLVKRQMQLLCYSFDNDHNWCYNQGKKRLE